MKTTVEVADDLYRQTKSEAPLRGRELKHLVEEGLFLSSKCRVPQPNAEALPD
jgi:hypothetical protein